jgi:hypothetical protein
VSGLGTQRQPQPPPPTPVWRHPKEEKECIPSTHSGPKPHCQTTPVGTMLVSQAAFKSTEGAPRSPNPARRTTRPEPRAVIRPTLPQHPVDYAEHLSGRGGNSDSATLPSPDPLVELGHTTLRLTPTGCYTR